MPPRHNNHKINSRPLSTSLNLSQPFDWPPHNLIIPVKVTSNTSAVFLSSLYRPPLLSHTSEVGIKMTENILELLLRNVSLAGGHDFLKTGNLFLSLSMVPGSMDLCWMFFSVHTWVAILGKTERKSISAFFFDGLRLSVLSASISNELLTLFFIGHWSAGRSLTV